MSVLLILLAFVGAIAVLVARALAVDEIKGRIQRRITASLEATIASLPDELQAEWGDEWRAELAAIITMPLTAGQFARGVRRSTRALVADSARAPADVGKPAPALSSRRSGSRFLVVGIVGAAISVLGAGAVYISTSAMVADTVTIRLAGVADDANGVTLDGVGAFGGVVMVLIGGFVVVRAVRHAAHRHRRLGR